jgi:hypothetical protein
MEHVLRAFPRAWLEIVPLQRAGSSARPRDKSDDMTQLRTPWTLALCLVTLALAPACKKSGTTAPDGEAARGAASDAASGDAGEAGGYDGPSEEILTVDAFEEAMQRNQSDVADCFAQAKEQNPELAGRLALDITVAGDGSVAGIKFEDSSTIKEASITSCVEEKAKGWRFPKTRDGGEMTLPYALNLS